MSLFKLVGVSKKAMALIQGNVLKSSIQKRVRISEIRQGITDYHKNMSGGKFLICPNLDDPALENIDENDDRFMEFDIADL